ncbi:MAG: ATP-binding protein [Gammaproteobacteria bacterium]
MRTRSSAWKFSIPELAFLPPSWRASTTISTRSAWRPIRPRDGYGLGLSIVSRIVGLLGLKLDVQSEVGKGTVFSLTLPASDANAETPTPAAQSTPALAAPAAATKAHVLLVEDDVRVRNATRLLLKVEGYQVTAVSSLAEATEAAAAHPDIGLLVTDFHLGSDETGVHVIAAVRAQLRRAAARRSDYRRHLERHARDRLRQPASHRQQAHQPRRIARVAEGPHR